jgi:hypothetical protein
MRNSAQDEQQGIAPDPSVHTGICSSSETPFQNPFSFGSAGLSPAIGAFSIMRAEIATRC